MGEVKQGWVRLDWVVWLGGVGLSRVELGRFWFLKSS
jgi:hypothetical protein